MIRTLRHLARIRAIRAPSNKNYHQLCKVALLTPRILSKFHVTLDSPNPSRNCSQKVHTPPEESLMDLKLYEDVCTETLEELNDYFEEILENTNCLDSAPDVTYSDGVLTVKISDKHGTYVINRQTPNRQIWLSSPQSGPKRFDYVPSPDNEIIGKWVYKHSGEVLHELLQLELSPILTDVNLDFLQLIHSGKVVEQ